MAHATVARVTSPDVLSAALSLFIERIFSQPEISLASCTQLDEGGYECGDPAVLQMLPDGDEACCGKHLRQKHLREALAEVRRG